MDIGTCERSSALGNADMLRLGQPRSADSVTMRFVRGSICRIFLRISGIMGNVMRDAENPACAGEPKE